MEINNANIYIFDHYIIIMVRKISFEIKKKEFMEQILLNEI